ncbi:MAG: hypothetical protein A2942_01705 [Candidatus Lloydbacteria bacterium RIFCSPLOWO2_01_FULL_50_20]|uniref:DUF192 domain-containing protein n=1 Tax=Candidatus Lloydbacteria bacterium RIFCSPLOWO2_01_FULL_50_20 TaxID=1798665 RepID=A0A1G2DEG3_9BACT|nr:MAG: hypothetical protein A2942_01705 [Candidatus Lloydbacteria bacterium RIFCSPLOWO2_01_FULL_50_20]
MARLRSKLRMKYLALAAIVLTGAVLFLLNNGGLNFYRIAASGNAAIPESILPKFLDSATTVSIGSTEILVEIATTTADIRKGLSGRPSLDPRSGMLFMFPKPYMYKFWMSDMLFPLDMIWIDNGIVVDISPNATTTFNPAAPNFYFPDEPAQYVLEVNVGFTATHGIVPGDTVTFKNIPLLP